MKGNINRWSGRRGVWTPNKKMWGITDAQLDALAQLKKDQERVEPCIDNGVNVCTCRRCNPPVPKVDDGGDLPF